MAFDGLVICALAQELNEKLAGSRLDKIYQPESDELLLTLHGPKGAFKVTLSANPSIPRIALTETTKENPMTAPLFCMLLRKHLQSAHLVSVRQTELERMLSFDFETRNELGDLVQKSLIIEIMGRHSNIILVDEAGRISDSIKRVDFSVSSKRQILPGLPYELPPAQNKVNPLSCSLQDFVRRLSDIGETERLDRAILDRFQGISPLIAREIMYLAQGDGDPSCGTGVAYTTILDIATAMHRLFSEIREGHFSPCFLTDAGTGKLIEFSAVPVLQYGPSVSVTYRPSMGYLIQDFYAERDKRERIARRSADLNRIVSSQIERCAKKLSLQTAELADTEKRELFREYGELITANLYQIEKGMDSVRVQNYYDPALPMIQIPMDKTLSPAANAQRYFKKYNKAKTAAEVLIKQIRLAKEELEYLETVEEALSRAETTADLSEIAEELASQGYIHRPKTPKRKKEASASLQVFKTKDDFILYLGKNNRQNDYLTCKFARNKDLWFHTKNIPGSHVVLRYENDRPFSDQAILEAAALAAYHSKASDSENVPVDYTEIKNVKKPSGAKPGFVIYTTNQTAYVMPKSMSLPLSSAPQ